ncbi:MAG TPA: acyl-CoA dehydrogenase family protein [Solirubrobacteraceae bacterium]|jgi:alkylation response protein AidB-like acyl-CoA dehydrogenase|nr:acyl-CoA dehydrogenase family protein [Solirubrobacteraceae bacterium]
MKRTIFAPEHDDFREAVAAFIAKEAVPHSEAWEQAGMVDRSFWRKAAALGFVGFAAPEQYGGLGVRDFRFNAILDEEMSYAGAVGDNFSLQNDVLAPYLVEFTTPEQQARWLPRFTSGELVAAIAMSEPGMGSDLRAMSTVARRSGEGYVINGSKTFVTSGIQADLVIVCARVDDAKGRSSSPITLFAVEAGAPGFEHGRKLEKIGRRAQDTAELFLTDVEVAPENRIGGEGEGLTLLKRNLPQERLSIATTAVAVAEAALDLTLDYCRERRTFGKPIGEHQAIRFALADMKVKLDMARAYLDRCIEAHVHGELTAEEAAGAKLATSELQFEVVDRCLQLHGGYGYMEEYAIARIWRDSRVQRIYGGTSEIMKEIVGRSMGF